jgi:hypothetical protein
VVDSIGGKVGSLQYLKDFLTGDVALWLAPADPTATRAAVRASRESGPIQRFIAPPLLDWSLDPSVNIRRKKMRSAISG